MLDRWRNVGGVHLPDPAVVRSLPEHAQRQLPLVLLATSGGHGGDLPAIRHRLVEGRELVRSAPHRLGDPLAARLGVGADVVDDQTLQPVRVLAGVRHRDDAAHGRAGQGEAPEPEGVDERAQVTGLVAVLVGAGRSTMRSPRGRARRGREVKRSWTCRASALNAWALDV